MTENPYIKLPTDPDDAMKVNLILLIGRLTVEWANLESWFIKILASLLKTDTYRAEIVFFSYSGGRARRVLINRLLKVFVPDSEMQAKFEKLDAAFAKATATRNEFCQAIYDLSGKPYSIASYRFPMDFEGTNYVTNQIVDSQLINKIRQAIARCEELQSQVTDFADAIKAFVQEKSVEQSHTHAERPGPPSTPPHQKRGS